MDENQLLQEIIDILSTWGCVLTEGKCPTYKEMLNGLLERSNRVVGRHRKDEFDKLVAIHGWKSFPVSAWIELIADEPTIDPAALNRKIEKGNKMLKTKMTDFIEVLKKTSTYDYFKKQFGEIFTPLTLVNEMLDKLPSHVWNNPKLLWLDPACGSGNFLLVVKQRLMEGLCKIFPDAKEREQHILENMLHGVDLQVRNVVLASMQLDPEGIYELHLEREDSLKFNFWGKQFDIVVGNPPYQPPTTKGSQGAKGARNQLWPKFVGLALDICNPDGYICFVHPAAWRKPLSELWDKLKVHHFLYLEIHNRDDGKIVFNVGTAYDWYVLQKNVQGTTLVKDEKGAETQINFHVLPFLPNYNMDTLEKILAKDGEPTAKVMFSYQLHETRKPWMHEEIVSSFIHPCVHATPKTGPVKYWYSSKKSEFFVPKVIFGDAEQIANVVVDDKGEFGITQHAMAIPISSKREGEQIKRALESIGFGEVVKAFRWSNFQIDWRMFQFFRKDFWREFL